MKTLFTDDIREDSPTMPEVSSSGMLTVAAVGALGGFVAGFSVAERVYASESQKSSVRFVGNIALAAVAVTAAAGAMGIVRARAA